MVKLSSSDLLYLLRKFNIAGEENVPRHIEQVKITNPGPKNTLAAFRFNKAHYYALIDNEAEDQASYIMEQIQTDRVDVGGELLQNPGDTLTTYGMPFKGKDAYLFVVKSDKKRLDLTLAERYTDNSRSTWQKHIKAGHVSVNGKVVSSPKYDVTEADSIAVSIPDDIDYSEHTLPIVYLDDNVIVINKPAGILTHAKGALNEEFTVAEFFRRYTTYNSDSNRPGIIHRLDRDTSGVMIGARNPETATLLQKQFADRKTKKTYMAVVDGVPKNNRAVIDLPIGRNPSTPSTFRVDAKGKSAQTEYAVVSSSGKLSLVELKPHTGRTHQLRVHMQYLGTPIHGDRVYGKPSDRLYLHAAKLEVTIPVSDRRVFEAPTPAEFAGLIDGDSKS